MNAIFISYYPIFTRIYINLAVFIPLMKTSFLIIRSSYVNIISALVVLFIGFCAYYISIYYVFTVQKYTWIPLIAMLVFAGLSFFLVTALSFQSTSIFLRALATTFYTKTICEMCIVCRIILGWDKNFDVFLGIVAILNVVRSILKNILAVGFDENKKIEYYADVIKFDKCIVAMSEWNWSGSSDRCVVSVDDINITDNDIKKWMLLDRHNIVVYSPKTLFGMLCDVPHHNEVAKIIHQVYGPNNFSADELLSNIKNNEYQKEFVVKMEGVIPALHTIRDFVVDTSPSGRITLGSIKRIYNEKVATELLRILTQGLDDSLSYEEFYENIRQLNIERRSFGNFLHGNKHILKILRASTWILFLIISVMATGKLLALSYFMKFLVYPFLMFTLPWLVNLFDSFIFIIYIHPYDIEDRVFIEDENLIVKSINLTATVFEKWNNELVTYPNVTLKDKLFKNIRRSKNQQKIVSVMIRFKDIEKIADVREYLNTFTAGNPAFSGLDVVVSEILECNFAKVEFRIKHSINHQNGYFMWVVQNRFMKCLVSILKKHRIKYRPLDLPLVIEKIVPV